jgi:hypothetical protein
VSLYRTSRSIVGAVAREALLYKRWAAHRRCSPTILILPSHDASVGSSNLRAYAIGDALANMGWSSVICPKHLRLSQRLRVARIVKPDIILIQKSRHLLNRPRFFPGIPCIFDIDDADFVDDRRHQEIVECVSDSVSVIAGSKFVAEWCAKYNDRVDIVWTGTPISPTTPPPQNDRKPIVTWAATMPDSYRDEIEFVSDVADNLVKSGQEFTLRFYSDDGSPAYCGFADRFRAKGIEVETMPMMPYVEFLSTLEDVAVGLHPLVDIGGYSAGKSFGKVLAYLDRGVPIVTHPVADHPDFFCNGNNGIMADGAEVWADHIVTLLRNPAQRQKIANQGHHDLVQRLSVQSAATQVDNILKSAIRRKTGVE